MRVWLKCLCVFSLILGLTAANGVYRVSRQDFPANKNPSPAAYQQPFEKNNGVYRVQRQDFTNGNDVPFSDPYSNSYGNRFSKLNYGSGDVNPSYTPLPKLFLPAGVQKTENPYLAIGIPNYDRVMPASDFGKEVKARTSAPTRINLRPKTTIYDEKQYDDGALPALPNYPNYDSALPSISEYSKSSSFGEDFSTAVEQFNMTEDRKNICTGANCRRSNENDDADAVRPIRRRRSIDHDPYNSFGEYDNYEPRVHFRPHEYRTPVSDHEYDRVYAHLVPLSRNRPIRLEESSDEFSDFNSEISTEQTEVPRTPLSFPEYNENPSNDNNDEFHPSFPRLDQKTPEPEPSNNDLEFPPESSFDPSLSLNFDALVARVDPLYDQETTTIDDSSLYHSASTTETPETTADPSLEDGMNYTPIECEFPPETIDFAAKPTENAPDSEYNSEVSTNSNEISTDPLLSVDFESLIGRAHHLNDGETTNNNDFNFDDTTPTTESPDTTTNPNLDDGTNNYPTPIECDFMSETTNFENNFDSSADHSTTASDSEYISDVTTNPNEISSDSENNSEVSTTQIPEEQTEEDIPTTDKKLILEYKFRVTFVCMMWPDVYQKSSFDSYDSRDIKMYHLCKFFNALNAYPSDTSNTKPDCEGESGTSTDGESISSELIRNYLMEIFQGNEQTAGLSSDNNADYAETGLTNESETDTGNIVPTEPLITQEEYLNFLNQVLGGNENTKGDGSKSDDGDTDSVSVLSPIPTVMDVDDVQST